MVKYGMRKTVQREVGEEIMGRKNGIYYGGGKRITREGTLNCIGAVDLVV